MGSDRSEQKVPMAILSNEAFCQNFELWGSAILGQFKVYISAKDDPIDLRLAVKES